MEQKKKVSNKEFVKKEPVKKQPVKGIKITLIKQRDNLDIDTFYDRKMKGVIKKIKDQNTMIDDKIRFGWNTGDPV
jgi:hypothetical protein